MKNHFVFLMFLVACNGSGETTQSNIGVDVSNDDVGPEKDLPTSDSSNDTGVYTDTGKCEIGHTYSNSCVDEISNGLTATREYLCSEEGVYESSECQLTSCVATFSAVGNVCISDAPCAAGSSAPECVFGSGEIANAWVPTNDVEAQPIDPTPYLKTYTLPSCTDDDAMIIDSDDDWAQINTSSKRVFCVKPGDYRSVGKISLTSSGVDGTPRVLRLLNPMVPRGEHIASISPQAFKMNLADSVKATNAQMLSTQLALLPSIEFNGGSFWIVDRMTFYYVGSHPILYKEDAGSHDNIINGIRIENDRDGVGHENGNHRNSFQNSFIYRAGVGENVCIGFQGWYKRDMEIVNVHDTLIVNNELRDCGDGIQTTVHKLKHNFEGTKIISNNIYLTNDKYADCGSGNRNTNGECACAENAIDIKAASSDPEKPMLIKGNVLSGWRQAVATCDGVATSHSDWGGALVVHLRTDNIIVEDNIAYNSDRTFDSVPFVNNLTVRNNLFHGARSIGVVMYGEGDGACLDKETREMVTPCPYTQIKFINNIVYVDDKAWISTNEGPRDSEFSCNVIIGKGYAAGVPGPRSVSSKNAFYGPSKGSFSGAGDLSGTIAEASHAEICVNITPFSDEIERCLPLGKATPQSNHPCDDIGVRMD